MRITLLLSTIFYSSFLFASLKYGTSYKENPKDYTRITCVDTDRSSDFKIIVWPSKLGAYSPMTVSFSIEGELKTLTNLVKLERENHRGLKYITPVVYGIDNDAVVQTEVDFTLYDQSPPPGISNNGFYDLRELNCHFE